jgi:hypothetical protein
MSVQDSIEFVKEHPVCGSNYMEYEQHALNLVAEIERLKGIIKNTTHGRKKIESDFREESVVRERDIVKVDNQIFHVITEEDTKYFNSETHITIEKAQKMIDEGRAMRIPETMYYGGNYQYMQLSTGHIAVFGISDRKNRSEDDGFFHTINIWIPQPEKKKYVKLGIVCQGEDRWEDRIRYDTSHYKGESNFKHYLSKYLMKPGVYKEYIQEALGIYREITNNPTFLLKEKK